MYPPLPIDGETRETYVGLFSLDNIPEGLPFEFSYEGENVNDDIGIDDGNDEDDDIGGDDDVDGDDIGGDDDVDDDGTINLIYCLITH